MPTKSARNKDPRVGGSTPSHAAQCDQRLSFGRPLLGKHDLSAVHARSFEESVPTGLESAYALSFRALPDTRIALPYWGRQVARWPAIVDDRGAAYASRMGDTEGELQAKANKKTKAKKAKAPASPPPKPKGFELVSEMDDNAIFDNAIDSLEMAVSFHNKKNRKWAILASFHCIELLLKEALFRTHRLLIYRDLDKPIEEDSFTVGFDDAIKRFVNIGIELDPTSIAALRELKTERNRIEHHRFEPSPKHDAVLGQSLRFIHRFMKDELGDSVEDHVSTKDYEVIDKLILDYQELVDRERSKIDSKIQSLDPKEREFYEVGECPECGEQTATRDADGSAYCGVCRCNVDARRCERCADFGSVDERGHCWACARAF